MAGKGSLEIIATGKRNVRSQGSEVWFGYLARADGSRVPHEEMRWDRGWEVRDHNGAPALCSHQRQPARLRWKGRMDGPMRLALASHSWSGVAQIRFNGVRRTVDLYSDRKQMVFDLDPADPRAFAPDDGAHLDQRVYRSRPPSVWTYANPIRTGRDLWMRRHLIWQFAMRDLLARYRGSYLGAFWSILNPLLMLVVYTIVFGGLFKRDFGQVQAASGLPPSQDNQIVFGLILFTGLLVFNIFSECVAKAPRLIVGNSNYVKRVVFPLEILPVSILVSSLINSLIMLGLFFLGSLLFLQRFCMTALLFPLVLIPVIMLSLGLGWFFSSLGVFVRDIDSAIGVAVSALFFMSAIFYSIEDFGVTIEHLLRLNPMANLVDDARRTLILGLPPHWLWWAGMLVLSALVMQAGYIWFMKSKRWFSDVI